MINPLFKWQLSCAMMKKKNKEGKGKFFSLNIFLLNFISDFVNDLIIDVLTV